MGGTTLKIIIKSFLNKWSWKIFLWSISCTDIEYWNRIYLQEKYEREKINSK